MSATSAPSELNRVVGPTALGSDPARLWRLAWTLAVLQFRLKFYGSVLGYLWQLMRPLMLFGVLYVVFSLVVRLGEQSQYYPVVLLLGIVLYTFVSEATSTSVNALVEREPLLRKVDFPRLAVPIAVVLTALMNLSLNLVVVIFFAILSGVDLHATLWQAPLVLGVLVLMVLGGSMLVSALYVRYRDIQPISDVFLQMLFYGSPIIFPIEIVAEKYREWLMLNPFAVIIQQMRHATIDPSIPSAFDVGGWQTCVSLAFIVVLAIVGFVVFRRRAPYVAEDL